MIKTPSEDAAPLDADTARLFGKVRWLMLVSGATTLVAVAAVLGVIGYRLMRGEGRPAAPADVTVLLPKDARVIATAASGDRIVVTVDHSGTTEIRVFDLHTLRQVGRLRLATEP
jgi:hypothetical protein